MTDDHATEDLPVIAIGASAGGLEACRALLKDIPYEELAEQTTENARRFFRLDEFAVSAGA